MDQGLVPISLLRPPPGRHGGAGIAGQETDASLAGRHPGKIHGRAEVPGVAHRDRTNAVYPGSFNGLLHRLMGDDLTDAVVAIH